MGSRFIKTMIVDTNKRKLGIHHKKMGQNTNGLMIYNQHHIKLRYLR